MTSRSQFGAFIPFSAALVDEEAGVDTYIVRAMANNAVHLGDSFAQVRIATRPNTDVTKQPSADDEFAFMWQTSIPVSVKEDGTSVALRWGLSPFVSQDTTSPKITVRMVVAPTASLCEGDKDNEDNENVGQVTTTSGSSSWQSSSTPITIPDEYVALATTRDTNTDGFDVIDAWYTVQLWGASASVSGGWPAIDGIYLAEYMK